MKNSPFYSVGEQLLSAIFFQIQSGSEEDVTSALAKKKHRNLFKGLGTYDIISLFESTTFEDPLLFEAESKVNSAQAVCAYKIGSNSISIDSWLNGASLVGFIFLELDKWLYTAKSGAGSGIEACQIIGNYILSKKIFEPDDLALFGGFGRSEIYILLKTDSFEKLWKFVEFTRSITFVDCFEDCVKDDGSLPVFFRTKTIPLISYKNIIKKQGSWVVSGINGKTMATLRVSCPSGFEGYLGKYFPKDEYVIEDVFGDDDIFIKTLNPIESTSVIEKIISFREAWKEEHIAPIVTKTIIHRVSTTQGKHTAYQILNPRINISISKELNENNPWLANRILSFLHRLVMVFEDRSNANLVHNMPAYVSYLNKSMEGHMKMVQEKQLSKIHYYESLLLEAIDNAEVGLAQRINSSFDRKQIETPVPLPFGDGILTSVVSLEVFIDSIFDIWSREREKFQDYNDSWSGFAIFSDSVGFRLRWGEVVFLPLSAATRPFSDNGNWLTITHEISHAIYIRLEVGTTLRKEYENIYKMYFVGDSVANKKLPNYEFFEDEMGELFAHWYDYHHFYNDKMSDYLINIWRSWIKLPVVEENFSEYFLRSFVIFATGDYNKILEASSKGAESYRDYIVNLWDEHLKFFDINLNNILKKYTYIIAEDKDDLLVLFQKYAPIIFCFHNHFHDAEFTTRINEDYPELHYHVTKILEGNIITGKIENPYLLTKRISEAAKFMDLPQKINTAFILSQKNQRQFLKEYSEST